MLHGSLDSMHNSHHQHRRYATERFVEIVWRGVHSAEDPRTIPLWAQISGTSRSPLSTLCTMLGVSPRGARDFTRLFRALVMAGGDAKELHEILNVSAPTTLDELFARAGLEPSVTLTPLEFLERQRLVRNEHVLDALKRALERTAPAAEPG
jgi:AraC-like DNA-binding protein